MQPESGPSTSPFKKIPKPVLIVGGTAGVVILYVLYKNHQAANAANSAAANPYGAPQPGSGVLNPIVLSQPGSSPGSTGDTTTTTGTAPTDTGTTTPTSTTTQPPGLRQIGSVPGIPDASLAGVNADAYNFMIHTPAPGFTGLSWSKLSPAQKVNEYMHIPASYLSASGKHITPGQTQTLAQIINEMAHRPAATPASTPHVITSKVVG